MQQERVRVQCPQCTRYFVRKADGNPWSHKCVIRQVQNVPIQPRPQVIQPRPQVVQPRPQVVQPRPQVVQPRPQVILPPDLEFLEQKNFQQYIDSILDTLKFEKEKIAECFKQQESIDEIQDQLGDGLYLELCNNLLKEVKHRGEKISNYEKLLQDLLQHL